MPARRVPVRRAACLPSLMVRYPHNRRAARRWERRCRCRSKTRDHPVLRPANRLPISRVRRTPAHRPRLPLEREALLRDQPPLSELCRLSRLDQIWASSRSPVKSAPDKRRHLRKAGPITQVSSARTRPDSRRATPQLRRLLPQHRKVFQTPDSIRRWDKLDRCRPWARRARCRISHMRRRIGRTTHSSRPAETRPRSRCSNRECNNPRRRSRRPNRRCRCN
jgi:hypothetical protein